MASSPKGVRLSPPLMFAFREAHRAKDAAKQVDNRDASGTRVLATRRSQKASVSEAQLRAQLGRDLDTLMNTTNMNSAEDISEFEHVSRSVLNYGLPDFVHRSLDENRTDSIVNEIEAAITAHEPRLIRNTIRVTRDKTIDAGTLGIRFIVHGEMSADPVAVPVEFVADLEVATGKLAVNKR